MPKYKFHENNSGGSWWLSEADYENLLSNGWCLAPGCGDEDVEAISLSIRKIPARSLGVYIEKPTIREAVESFEAITGKCFWEQGCNCCGAPFSISSMDEPFEYVSGDDAVSEARAPWEVKPDA